MTPMTCAFGSASMSACTHSTRWTSPPILRSWTHCPSCPKSPCAWLASWESKPPAKAIPKQAVAVIRANFEGPALLLGELANRFEKRNRGCLIGVSSVAGDRGRARNYVYGAAKAGFTAFLSGLRNRLAAKSVRVLTIKPGFVATRMTDGMALPPALTAAPDDVGRAIYAAYASGRDIVYVRPVWRVIMAVIRMLPEAVFKRLDL